MPPKQQGKQPAEPEGQGPSQRKAALGQLVMHTLGRPGALHRVQVCPLWDDHYRVNVLVGADAASAKIAHSFFLRTDGDGNIVASIPRITRRYEAPDHSGC